MEVTYNQYTRSTTIRCGDVHYHVLWAWPELGEPHTTAHCLVRDSAGRMWEYY